MFRLALFVAIFLSLPTVVWGSSVVRSGDMVSIAADQVVEGDFYGLANTVTVSGEVVGDLMLAGMDTTINGKVDADLATVAGRVDVHGVIGDDARIVAGEVVVAGEIKGDLVVIANSLEVLSTAKIEGDILFFGSQADISGYVGKAIIGTSEKMRIDGVVGGDIDITTQSLVLGERTDVSGTLKYTSAVDVTRAQNARVSGKVVRNDPVFASDKSDVKELLVSLLIVLFATLVWYLFFRRLLERVVVQTESHPLRSFLMGFGIFFLTPIAVVILLMSTLGSLLGITLLLVYFALILMGITITGITTGVYLAKLVKKSGSITIPVVVIGTVSMFALLYIPVVGSVVIFGLLFITLGALATHLYRIIRFS